MIIQQQIEQAAKEHCKIHIGLTVKDYSASVKRNYKSFLSGATLASELMEAEQKMVATEFARWYRSDHYLEWMPSYDIPCEDAYEYFKKHIYKNK